MIGAIAGDIIGSVYEARPIKTKEFPLFHPHCRFTDDSVLTIAVAQAILTDQDYCRWVWEIGRRHPHAGYGGTFIRWLHSGDPQPYNSWGNGSAMRVSPVGWAFDRTDIVLREAARSAEISHNHPEGIKGAQATALAVFLARTEHNKALIKREITARFGYDLNRTVDSIRPSYGFDVSCQGTVPEAIPIDPFFLVFDGSAFFHDGLLLFFGDYHAMLFAAWEDGFALTLTAKLNFDPAVVADSALTTIVDIVELIIY
jgi:ADP-ribosylglycohydrolase